MSKAVTVPSLLMMTSIVSEESLVRDTHTHARTHTYSFINIYITIHSQIHTSVSSMSMIN